VETFDERRDEVTPRLLAVGDDVDPGLFLVAQREAHRVALAFGERRALELPRRPQRFRLGEPRWLRQTSGDRRTQQPAHFFNPRASANFIGCDSMPLTLAHGHAYLSPSLR